MRWDDLIQASYINKQWLSLLHRNQRRTFAAFLLPKVHEIRTMSDDIYTHRVLNPTASDENQDQKIDSNTYHVNLEAFHDTIFVEPACYQSRHWFHSLSNRENKDYSIQFTEQENFHILALSSSSLCVVDSDCDTLTTEIKWIKYDQIQYTVHSCQELNDMKYEINWVTVDPFTGHFYCNFFPRLNTLLIIDKSSFQIQPLVIQLETKQECTRFCVNSDPDVNLCYVLHLTPRNTIIISTFQLTTGSLLQKIEIRRIYSSSLWTCHPHQPHLFIYQHSGIITVFKYERQGLRGCSISHHRLPLSLYEDIHCASHLHCYENTLYLTYSTVEKPHEILVTSIPCSELE